MSFLPTHSLVTQVMNNQFLPRYERFVDSELGEDSAISNLRIRLFNYLPVDVEMELTELLLQSEALLNATMETQDEAFNVLRASVDNVDPSSMSISNTAKDDTIQAVNDLVDLPLKMIEYAFESSL